MIRCSSSTATMMQTCSLLIPRLYVLVLSLNSCKYPGIAVTCSHRPCFFKYSSCSVIVMLCLGNLLSFQMKNSGFLLPLNETGQYHSSHCMMSSNTKVGFPFSLTALKSSANFCAAGRAGQGPDPLLTGPSIPLFFLFLSLPITQRSSHGLVERSWLLRFLQDFI